MAIETPESMVADLAAWNNGDGIDLESWINSVGNFGLAVGYLTVFCPQFVEFEGYILREGFSESSLRGFEKSCSGDRKAVEAVMNHLHIADIQHYGCEDLSEDKVVLLGSKLKEIYESRLQWQFPNDDIEAYEITFWQEGSRGWRRKLGL